MKGEATYAGRTKGFNLKGDSKLEFRAAAADAARAADDAVTRQKVPREYRQHTKDYFDRLNQTLDE